MRLFVQFFLSVLASGLLSAAALANNNFSAALPIGGTQISGTSGNLTATTAGANGQTGEPGAFPAGSALNTMWYSWTAPTTGTVTFETCTTTTPTVDTVIASYTGNAVNALAQIVQNDDTTGCASAGNPNFGSRIAFSVTSGTTYHIQVDGYGGNTGAFRLAWSLAAFNITKTQSGGANPISGAGQTITYSIQVQNAGAVALTTPTLTDAFLLNGTARTLTTGPALISGDAAPTGSLDPTETWTYTATYLVTLADMNGTGNFTNQATFDTAQTDPKSTTIVTTPVTRTPALSMAKSYVFLTDANSNNIADVGDVIRYSYTVNNTGNVTISGVSVSDTHNGEGPLGAIAPSSVATLNPGSNTVFQADYTVVQGDIDFQ
jgi:hypothetical protein